MKPTSSMERRLMTLTPEEFRQKYGASIVMGVDKSVIDGL